MKDTIRLKGITWGHSRGYTPLVACAQRYEELHPEVSVTWTKRTLQEFADYPIEKLVHDYDLLIIDHPWAGCAAATQCVLPLDEYLPAAYLADQARHTAGPSHQSYHYGGHQWALAIDAATPVASYRQDLMERHGAEPPADWDAVIRLAEKGRVAAPGIPIDLLMNFYMFCLAQGRAPFANEDEVTDTATGTAALQMMQTLWSRLNKQMFQYNPVAVAERMTASDDFWYCPFAYGYSNYARRGYARHRLQYADLVKAGENKLCSTLGGTGLAVSAFSAHRQEAVQFAQWAVSPEVQATLYMEHGGQPGHRLAWESEDANHLTGGYFRHTLPALQRAYVRPRYNGYLHFQDHAGNHVQHYLQHGGSEAAVLNGLNGLYRQSLRPQHV
ncbi:extracellular solute-binding protein [Chitinophaga alhagiae]|uniref:extracellular solute-binding protein n=1 Tax=Chitinophaga alhagiae TaxID=2203219 RepID=UPI000E5AE9C3|nr:extracellular solute-binding protein [Chitinophaga alhagiae]